MVNQDSQPTNSPRNSDEIDLSQIFATIGRGIRGFGNGILSGIASFRNLFFENRVFFAGVIGLGLLLGGVYATLIKKEFYRSTMVFSCDYLNTRILQNTIEKFNLLCEEKDREGLIRELKLDSATAANVYEFEFEPFVSEDDVVEMEVLREQLNNVVAEKKEVVDKVISKLVVENKNAYQISALVFDPTIVGTLEKAIVNYFKSSDYLNKRIQVNKINLQSRREKLISESKKLDSLKTVLVQNYQTIGKTNRGSGNVFLGDEKLANPLEVFDRDLDIYNEILDIDRTLAVQPEFEVVDSFTTIKQPDSASLPKILFIAFWVSFATGYLIIGIVRFDKLLQSYSKPKA